MRRTSRRTLLALLAPSAVLALLAPGAVRGQGAAYKIVVNAANPAATLTVKEASDAFLGRLTRWPDGVPVKPVDQSATSAVRAAFSTDVHGKKVDAILNHWQQVIFSGRGVPPPSKSSDEDVLIFVRTTRGAIGYVSAGAVTSDVKTLELVR